MNLQDKVNKELETLPAYQKKMEEDLKNCGVPRHMHSAYINYIFNGVPPGDFLTAVLSNQLKEAFSRADDLNTAHMQNHVRFLYEHAPIGCWYNPRNIDMWITSGGLRGQITAVAKGDAVREGVEEDG